MSVEQRSASAERERDATQQEPPSPGRETSTVRGRDTAENESNPDASAITVADAQALMGGQPFARWWGLSVTALGDGTADVRLPFGEHLVRPGGVLHGSCYEVVGDVAMWLAIMTITGIEPMAVTVEMKTSFLRGATTDITGRARVLKVGRRIAFGEASIYDESQELCAHSTLSYIRPQAATAP